MKALRFEKYGPPSVLSIQDLPIPVLEEGEVLVQIKHRASIHRTSPQWLGASTLNFR